ncbi:glycosyltransferase [bacterium]|nr:glycosyltransferase [bacterium]
MPRVSIIVPTYNRPHLLERALCSIMQQTFRDFEVIVVNDAGCSVENHVRKFKAFSIKTINLTANGGSSIARNKAIECASGKYIAYLDDDDIFYPEHIQSLYTAAESTASDFVYSECADVLENACGETIAEVERVFPPYHPSLIKRKNFIPVCCILHARALFEKTGFFDPKILFAEDWEMWFRMSRITSFYHLRKVTCEYRKSIVQENKNAQSKTLENNQSFANLLFEKYNIVADIRKRFPIIPEEVLQQVSLQFKNRPVYLYGAGSYCEQVIPALKNTLAGVFDIHADSVKENIKKRYGVDVLHPAEMVSMADIPVLSTVVDRIADVLESIYSYKGNVEHVFFLDDFFDDVCNAYTIRNNR